LLNSWEVSNMALPAGFDANAYLATNKDVADATASWGMTPEQRAEWHWTNYGQNEGRAGGLNQVAAATPAPGPAVTPNTAAHTSIYTQPAAAPTWYDLQGSMVDPNTYKVGSIMGVGGNTIWNKGVNYGQAYGSAEEAAAARAELQSQQQAYASGQGGAVLGPSNQQGMANSLQQTLDYRTPSAQDPRFGAYVADTPPAPRQPVINSNGSMGNNGPLSTLPGAPTPNTINAFNVDPNTPHTGQNWRDTATSDRSGASGTDFYGIFKEAWTSGKSPSQVAQEQGWSAGDVSAYEDYTRQWARDNGREFYGLRASPKNYKDYYTYGYGAVPDSTRVARTLPKFDPATGMPTGELENYTKTNPIGHYLDMWNARTPVKKATGGQIKGGLNAIEADPVIKGYVRGGKTGGQEDDIPALLSNNEYVMDADVVAALGDGNPDAGAAKLDKMRENIRKHKRGASHKTIPPKAMRPEQYLKGK
jgi:hypothetical protein